MTIIKPVIAIIGRPNVGKSTLFNRLTKSRDALVIDRPGVTRDRQYGIAHYGGRRFLVIDTGGIGDEGKQGQLAALMRKQTMLAVDEADVLVWLVDGRTGLTSVDSTLADTLRKLDKPVFITVNKVEGYFPEVATGDFFSLGMEPILPISAQRGDGIGALLQGISDLVPDDTPYDGKDSEEIVISVLGRPNVGKSTLVNRMVGEERVLTFFEPGTTRDCIRTPLIKNGKHYILIDTAGVRRKSRIQDRLEKFSVVKSFEAIQMAKIVMLVIDGNEGVTEQDTRLLGMIADSGKPLIIAINKWDCVDANAGKKVKAQLARRLRFIDYARHHYISALCGSGVDGLFNNIEAIEKCRKTTFSTSDMTAILQEACATHPPQMVRGRRIKFRYAHLGGTDPLRIIIHGNQTTQVSDDYKRYLAGVFRKKLKLVGTTVLIECRQGDNPYKNRKNPSMPRQINKRKRLIQHIKKRPY